MGRGDGRVLRELRRTRRRRHFRNVDFWDALYRVYVTAIFGSLGVAILSGYVGGERATSEAVDQVVEHGPPVVGLVVAGVVAVGLRSGARGGPIALEPADVHLVLLAPIGRRRALIGPALRLLRFAAFVGAVVGAVAGNLAARRLPGAWLAWVGSGAGTGATGGVAAVGGALIVFGVRGRRSASAAALALLGWSAADVLAGTETSPATFLGHLALQPLAVGGAPWLGVGSALVVGVAGLGLLGGAAVVDAQRRASLLAQLRFAVTLQDVRTVVLLRRLLSQEQPRARPWLRLRGGTRHPVWRRDGQGLLRWPAVRFARMVLLAAMAGVALVIAWRGTVVLTAIAGAALLVVALDAIEGLAQEGDVPTRRDSLPVDYRWLTVQHMVVPSAVMLAVAALGVVVATVAAGDRAGLALSVGGATVVPAALAAVCGAVLSVVAEPPDPLSPELMFAPELVAGTRFLMRMVAAPAVATAGVLPVLAARAGDGTGPLVAAAGLAAALTVALGAVIVLVYRGARRSA